MECGGWWLGHGVGGGCRKACLTGLDIVLIMEHGRKKRGVREDLKCEHLSLRVDKTQYENKMVLTPVGSPSMLDKQVD